MKSYQLEHEFSHNFGFNITKYKEGYLIANYDYVFDIFLLASRQENGLLRVDKNLDTIYYKPLFWQDYGLSLCTQKNAIITDTVYYSYFKNVSGINMIGLVALDAAEGTILWDSLYNFGPFFETDRVLLTDKGKLYLVISDEQFISASTKIICLNSSGIVEWESVIFDNQIQGIGPISLASLPTGDLVLGCALKMKSDPVFGYTGLLFLSPEGELQEIKKFDRVNSQQYWIMPRIHICKNGDILFNSVQNPENPLWYDASPVFYRMNSMGEVLWRYSSYDLGEQIVYKFKEMENGDVVAIGYSQVRREYHFPVQNGSAWILRLSGGGQLLYERRLLDEEMVSEDRLMWIGDFLEESGGKIIASGTVFVENEGSPFPRENLMLMTLNENFCFNTNCDTFDVMEETQSFAPISATWHYENWSEDCDASFTKLVATRDTLLENRKSREVLVYKNNNATPLDSLYFWEDDKVVYFYEDGEFKVLYDFTLQHGDTLDFYVPDSRNQYSLYCDTFYYPVPHKNKSRMTDESFIDVDGTFLRRYETEFLATSEEEAVDIGVVIERIGSLNGIGGETTYLLCIDKGCFGRVRCYQDPDIFYKNTAIDCDSTVVSVQDPQVLHSALKIYPNPVTDKLWIDASEYVNEVLDVTLTDILGQRIHRFECAPPCNIETSQLPEGLYHLSILTKSGFAKSMLVLKGE